LADPVVGKTAGEFKPHIRRERLEFAGGLVDVRRKAAACDSPAASVPSVSSVLKAF